MRSDYPVRLTLDANAELRATARDLPEVLTWGATEEEALANAADAIAVVVSAMLDEGTQVPEASPLRPGEHSVALPAQLAAKHVVIQAWHESGLGKSELARRLGLSEVEVRRVLDPRHGTRLDRMDAVVRALGKRLTIGVEAA